MLKSDIIPKQVSDLEIETFGDGVLLYHQSTKQAVHLNNSAAFIWALCNGNNNMAEIEHILKDAYPDGKDSIRNDMHATLEKLRQDGAIEFSW